MDHNEATSKPGIGMTKIKHHIWFNKKVVWHCIACPCGYTNINTPKNKETTLHGYCKTVYIEKKGMDSFLLTLFLKGYTIQEIGE